MLLNYSNICTRRFCPFEWSIYADPSAPENILKLDVFLLTRIFTMYIRVPECSHSSPLWQPCTKRVIIINGGPLTSEIRDVTELPESGATTRRIVLLLLLFFFFTIFPSHMSVIHGKPKRIRNR